LHRNPDLLDSDPFDLTGWEVDEVRPPPDEDPAVLAAARETQSAISKHRSVDSSADWDDFDVFLPDCATALANADNAEWRERLRLLLLRAAREGSVPQSAVDDLVMGRGDEADPEHGARLAMAINDLGAETDERFEYRAAHESFEVFVDPEETPDEEDAVAGALNFLDYLASRGNAALRIYQREIQRESVLTPESEVALGQGMERALERALDELAAWPAGLRVVVDAARKVASGAMPLQWLSSRPHADSPEVEVTPGVEPHEQVGSVVGTGVFELADGADEGGDSDFSAEFTASSDELGELCGCAEKLVGVLESGNRAPEWKAVRDTIATLSLSRNFLLQLADAGGGRPVEAAASFQAAMREFLRARDKMTVANLKLVFSIAKKYQFSGQPLDDLLQEGNLGLLKAVDRYDWRKGFKFSTYATWWIRQQVGRFVADKGRTIRVPVHIYEKIQRIAHYSRAFEFECGRAPTVEEIAAFVKLPISKATAIVRASHEPLCIECVDDLDDAIAQDAKDQFVARDPSDIVEDGQLSNLVDRLLLALPPKERHVVRMRFGLGVADAMTLEEIGEQLGVTRERVRQIEASALRKLKGSEVLKRLVRELNGLSSAEVIATERDVDVSYDGNVFTAKDSSVAHSLALETSASQVPTCQKTVDPVALDRLLDEARVMGLVVDDNREHGSRRILVRVTELPDAASRELVRKLADMGFEFSLGKGYWR